MWGKKRLIENQSLQGSWLGTWARVLWIRTCPSRVIIHWGRGGGGCPCVVICALLCVQWNPSEVRQSDVEKRKNTFLKADPIMKCLLKCSKQWRCLGWARAPYGHSYSAPGGKMLAIASEYLMNTLWKSDKGRITFPPTNMNRLGHMCLRGAFVCYVLHCG